MNRPPIWVQAHMRRRQQRQETFASKHIELGRAYLLSEAFAVLERELEPELDEDAD